MWNKKVSDLKYTVKRKKERAKNYSFLRMHNFPMYTFMAYTCIRIYEKGTPVKKGLLLTVLLILCAYIKADNPYYTPKQYNQKTQYRSYNYNTPTPYIITFDSGIFIPTDQALKEIFGTVWGALQCKFSVSIVQQSDFWNRLSFFTAINYTTKGGQSKIGNQETRIHLVPVSFGLRFVQPLSDLKNRMSLYAGIGMQASIARANNKSQFVDSKAHKSGGGGIAELGIYFHPCQRGVVTVGADYSYAKLGFYKPSTQNTVGIARKTSGFGLRVGLGATF